MYYFMQVQCNWYMLCLGTGLGYVTRFNSFCIGMFIEHCSIGGGLISVLFLFSSLYLRLFLFFCENIIALCKQYFIHFFLNENFVNIVWIFCTYMLLRISFKSPTIKSGMRNEFRNIKKRFTVGCPTIHIFLNWATAS